MIIHKMTATFGGLRDETLTLTPGLNVLEYPNEGGKSTWCAFLRAMFYGLGRNKGKTVSERRRYAPWSGAAAAGTVELTWQGRDLTLRRFPKGSDPFGGFEAVYTGTMEPVPGLTADNVGETLLGVPREVFERTAFIPQGGMTVDKAAALEARIAALASAGEEDVSFSQTERRLKDWRNARRANKSVGTIPALQRELEEVRGQKDRMARLRSRTGELEDTLEQLERDKKSVLRDIARHTALRAKAYKDRYDEALADLRASEDDLAGRQAALDALPPVPQVGPAPGKKAPVLPIVLLALGAGLLLTGALLPAWWLLALGAVIALTGTFIWLCTARKFVRDREDYLRAKEAQNAAQRQMDAVRAQAEEARWKLDAAQKVFASASRQGKPGEVPPLEGAPERSWEEDQARLTRLTSGIALCKETLAQSKGEAQGTGDYAALTGREEALSARLAREQETLDALELALEGLSAANARLQSRFSPAVSRLAGEYLSRLTGGRYETLAFDRDFHVSALAEGLPRESWLLSQGTADQAYLALRLAVCTLTLDEEAPVVLDDALVSFDDARVGLALELLKEFARTRQVLLFTCQSREKAALQRP